MKTYGGRGRAGTGSMRAPLAERGEDFYATPREAVDAFLDIERHQIPPGKVFEPACGDGAIVLPLRAAGYHVIASDLIDRGCPDASVGDFFATEPPGDISAIITNPPYKNAQRFIERALGFAPYVAMLLRLGFLEGFRRKPWLEEFPPARVHVASRRLPMMHRGGWDGPRVMGSAVCFAWFVWDVRRVAPTTLHWFDWKESEPAVALEDMLA
nr:MULTISPECIES: hypothetical protein [unclassified Chelatococcus]